MNTAKIVNQNEEEELDFSAMLREVMPRNNGTPEQFEALAEAFRRNGIPAEHNANDELQANLNKKCLPNPSKLTNEFKTKAA